MISPCNITCLTEKEGDILYQSNSQITALYCRLSREDEQVSVSGSIQNQRALLTDYANKHGYNPIKVFVEDGISGITFQRQGFQKMFGRYSIR